MWQPPARCLVSIVNILHFPARRFGGHFNPFQSCHPHAYSPRFLARSLLTSFQDVAGSFMPAGIWTLYLLSISCGLDAGYTGSYSTQQRPHFPLEFSFEEYRTPCPSAKPFSFHCFRFSFWVGMAHFTHELLTSSFFVYTVLHSFNLVCLWI